MSDNAPISWTESRLPFLADWRRHFMSPDLAREAPYLGTLPTLITVALGFMALSGLVLSVHYDPAQGYHSLQFVDRNVHNGWLVHAFHQTGTTMIFGAVFLQLFRSILTRSYRAPGDMVWQLDVVQLVLLLFVAWLGYVLADGAVSYWSLQNTARDATSLGGIPAIIGGWFFGGADNTGSLARMSVFHTVFAVAVFGIVALHYAGARALAKTKPLDKSKAVGFHPYYSAQYFVAFVVFALIFAIFVFFLPRFGLNELNQAPADPLVVIPSLVPPWYLAPLQGFADILPGNWGGLLGAVASFAVLSALPWLDRGEAGGKVGTMYRVFVFILALDTFGLALVVIMGPSLICTILAYVFAVYYFVHFLVITPVLTAIGAD